MYRYTTASSACCSKEQTLAVVDEQEGKQATTILRRTCYTKYKRRNDITDSQLRRMRDSLHDNKAEIKNLTYQMCDHMVKDTHYKLREEKVSKWEERPVKRNSVVSGSCGGFLVTEAN